jgi:hypothetical protein
LAGQKSLFSKYKICPSIVHAPLAKPQAGDDRDDHHKRIQHVVVIFVGQFGAARPARVRG